MNLSRYVAVLMVGAILATGCISFKRTKNISVDKTVQHSSGTLNFNMVQATAGVLEGRAGSGDWENLTAMSNKELESWFENQDSPEARSYIKLDAFNLELEQLQLKSAKELKNMKDYVDKRVKDLSSFATNSKSKLDVRKW